ncbi:MAG: HEAT repeat domain-containing protein [Myxococcota bacterium]
MKPDELRDLMGAEAEVRTRKLGEVLGLLESEDPRALQGALELLGHWRESAGMDLPAVALQGARRLTEHKAPGVRAYACAALALLTPAEELPSSCAVLEKALSLGPAEVRAEAAAALGDLKVGADALMPLLEDPVREVRFEAAFALAGQGQNRALPTLMGFMADRRHRADAIEALHRLGGPDTRAGLLSWVGSWRLGWVERQALDAALVSMGDEEARTRLLSACERGRFERRVYAFHLAGRTGLREAEPILWKSLKGRDDGLWGPAVEALRALGQASALRSWALEAPEAQAALIRGD